MGMSSNYIFINLTGYVMYTVYNLYGYVKGDNVQTGVVDTSDLLFSMHSVLVYGVTVGLFFYYPHKVEVSMWAKGYLAVQWVVFLYFGVQFLVSEKSVKLTFFSVKTGLGYFQTLGYFKMFSTLLKHPPQIYYNFKRKSTKGWSI
jgi:cystinosin